MVTVCVYGRERRGEWREGEREREVGERIYRVHVCVAICMSQYTNNSIILVCNTLYMCTICVGLIVTCVCVCCDCQSPEPVLSM